MMSRLPGEFVAFFNSHFFELLPFAILALKISGKVLQLEARNTWSADSG